MNMIYLKKLINSSKEVIMPYYYNCRKASMKIKRKVHNEYVLPVMVYGSETWALKKAHMELYSETSL